MTRTRTIQQMKEQPIKYKRAVSPYKRKVNNKMSQVREYIQSYNSPRGRITSLAPDNLTRHSQTIWLKDRYGHFVGRANIEGKTAAKNVTKFGYDETRVVRDAKQYKRIFGRTISPRRRVVRA